MEFKQTKLDPKWVNNGSLAGFPLGGGAAGGPGRYQQMFSWIKSRVPGAHLASGLRPGDPGYHGSGRATDLTFSDGSERRGNGMALKAFSLIKSTFMKNIKELIWDFAKGNAVWNGSNHFFTGSGAGPGTHCVPLDTEILTQDGWKRYDEVVVGDLTLGLNRETGDMEWTPVVAVNVYESGEVVKMSNARFTYLCTPEHGWIVDKGHTPGVYDKVQAADLLTSHRLIVAHPVTGDGLDITNAEARLLGWVLGDGSYLNEKQQRRTVRIMVRKDRKKRQVVKVLNESGLEWSIFADQESFYIKTDGWVELEARSGFDKREPTSFVLGLSGD
jgi:hypothetical protein